MSYFDIHCVHAGMFVLFSASSCSVCALIILIIIIYTADLLSQDV